MTKYMISVDEKCDRVYLENYNSESLQLSGREFNLLMLYPELSRKDIIEKYYMFNQEKGRKYAENIINIAFKIMGRELNVQ